LSENDPLFYYEQILRDFPNSFLAEDDGQIIIGFDCDYFYGDDLGEFAKFYENAKKEQISHFDGIFGVMSYEIVHKFEKIGDEKKKLYKFPLLAYADAKNYLYYDKSSKIYTFFGENFDYFEKLENLAFIPAANNKNPKFYEVKTDLEAEKRHFFDIIETAKEYLKKGDIFQVVLGEILEICSNLESLEFYKALRINNPSPYMFHFPTKFGTVVGSSPELILEMRNSQIFVAPIAGTRARTNDENENLRLKNELLSDEKELAEHRMLIDLARNDIGKFALPWSVSVKNPMNVVMYESVMHIKSEVYGQKRDDASIYDVLSVVFPAGTLSGSPKIRAMQIINELESSARGIYGGGIGFFHFNSNVQMAILIRSAIFIENGDENSVFIGAGAGIVLDSVPKNEYKEICNKRKSCVKIFEELCEKRGEK